MNSHHTTWKDLLVDTKLFITPMVFVKSLLIAVSRTLNINGFRAWAHWTVCTIIAVIGAFFYISAVRSMAEWSLVPLYIFFYPLAWFVIIGASTFASTVSLVITGWQDGFDKIPIASPLFVAKETIMFPVWFPKEVYRMLRSKPSSQQ